MIAQRKVFAPRNSIAVKLLSGLGLLLASGVSAEPYLAMRTGFKCSQCHVNRIGGGERTEYGSVYSQYKLLMTQTEDLMQAEKGGLSSFNPKLNDAITVGANFRVEEKMSPKYTYKTGPGPKTQSPNAAANIAEANLYINVELIKNFMSLYMDQTMAPATASREMWGMVRNLPLNGYVKVGKTLLPYGLRLMDDQAFIRDKTQYTYNNPDLAGEIGIEPGPLSLTLNMTNTRFSSVGSVVYRHFRAGGSYGANIQKAAPNTFETYGPFGGANFGRFTVMSEVDFIRKANTPDTLSNIHQIAQFYELDFLPVQGCNTKVTYEYFDRNTHVANKRDGQQRLTFGVEPFIAKFLQLGLYYQLNKSQPQILSENQDILTGRVHVFF